MERLHVNIQVFCIFDQNTWSTMAGLAGAIISRHSWDWFQSPFGYQSLQVFQCSI